MGKWVAEVNSLMGCILMKTAVFFFFSFSISVFAQSFELLI